MSNIVKHNGHNKTQWNIITHHVKYKNNQYDIYILKMLLNVISHN